MWKAHVILCFSGIRRIDGITAPSGGSCSLLGSYCVARSDIVAVDHAAWTTSAHDGREGLPVMQHGRGQLIRCGYRLGAGKGGVAATAHTTA